MKRTVTLVAILAIACVSILGCDTTEPNLEGMEDSESNLQETLAEKAGSQIYAPGKVGTIIINQDPDELEGARWSLTGPMSREGSGDATLTGMFAGEYTLSWTPVPGYRVPGSTTHACPPLGSVTFTGSYVQELAMILIPAGTFQMGSPPDEPGRDEPGREPDETLHTVTLTKGFYIAPTEVTEELWDNVMGSGASTSQLPQSLVTWDKAVAFCNQLSLKEDLTPAYVISGIEGDVIWNHAANGYRLPTEAEWEYACRAGSQTAFCNGPITDIDILDPQLDPNLDQVGWYLRNSEGVLHDVGQKSPNDWGLYDMHGNVYEWVWDGYRPDYENLPSVDPVYDVKRHNYRVIRGGRMSYFAWACRSANRHWYGNIFYETPWIGFRVVRSSN